MRKHEMETDLIFTGSSAEGMLMHMTNSYIHVAYSYFYPASLYSEWRDVAKYGDPYSEFVLCI